MTSPARCPTTGLVAWCLALVTVAAAVAQEQTAGRTDEDGLGRAWLADVLRRDREMVVARYRAVLDDPEASIARQALAAARVMELPPGDLAQRAEPGIWAPLRRALDARQIEELQAARAALARLRAAVRRALANPGAPNADRIRQRLLDSAATSRLRARFASEVVLRAVDERREADTRRLVAEIAEAQRDGDTERAQTARRELGRLGVRGAPEISRRLREARVELMDLLAEGHLDDAERLAWRLGPRRRTQTDFVVDEALIDRSIAALRARSTRDDVVRPERESCERLAERIEALQRDGRNDEVDRIIRVIVASRAAEPDASDRPPSTQRD